MHGGVIMLVDFRLGAKSRLLMQIMENTQVCPRASARVAP